MFVNLFISEYGNGTWDYIIAGGGTAGLILAHRLTEANFSVLIIDAGDKDPDVSAILGWYLYYMKDTKYSWMFNSTTQEKACLSKKWFEY